MSLKVKVASIISALIVIVSVTGAIVEYTVFSGAFEELEREEAVKHLDEVTRAFETEVRDLDRISRWYATAPPALSAAGRSSTSCSSVMRRAMFVNGSCSTQPRGPRSRSRSSPRP